MQYKVLIVDDHDDFRRMIKEFLLSKNLNLEIFEAWTAEMGVAKANCVKPDIVLMDINLPNSNGIAATRLIKEDLPGCSVIIVTMFEVEAFRKIANQIKVEHFIGKSEVFEKLLLVIEKCLAVV